MSKKKASASKKATTKKATGTPTPKGSSPAGRLLSTQERLAQAEQRSNDYWKRVTSAKT